MKKAIYLLALFIFGTAAAQDSTFTKTVTTTTKKTERVVKKKRNAPVISVNSEEPLHSNDTIYTTKNPVRRDDDGKLDVKVYPAKQ